jgi:phenazine biosynthesis protein phzE
VLADELGLAVRRLKTPRQGLQQTISLYGRPERVGFYNTFVATSGADRAYCPFTGEPVRVLRNPITGAVHALAKPRMRSTQFHVESVLTENGPAILRRMMLELVAEAGRVTSATLPGGGTPVPYGK